MTTKTTAELVPGDRVVFHDLDERRFLLPIDEDHPGPTVTILAVKPWMLTAGPRAGQQATDRRGKNGKPMYTLVTSEEDERRSGGMYAGTLDREWTIA